MMQFSSRAAEVFKRLSKTVFDSLTLPGTICILTVLSPAMYCDTGSAGSSNLPFTQESLPARQRQPTWLPCLSSRLKKYQTSGRPSLKAKEINSSYRNQAVQFIFLNILIQFTGFSLPPLFALLWTGLNFYVMF